MIDDKMIRSKVKALDDEMVSFRKEVEGPGSVVPFGESSIKATKSTFGDMLRLLGPDAEEIGEEEFAAVVKMTCKILNDAVDDMILDADMACEPPQSDEDLRYLAAKLKTALKDSAFRRWLKEQPVPAESPAEEAAAEPTQSIDEQLIAAATKRM